MSERELIRLALDVGFIHGRFAKVAEACIDDAAGEDIAMINNSIKECVKIIRGVDGEFKLGNGC